MTLEAASYIAAIIAAIAGIGSLYYAREQHKKHNKDVRANVSVTTPPTHPMEAAQNIAPAPVAVQYETEGISNELLSAFETTKSMFNKPARDSALKALVEKALATHRTEFAIAVASEMWNKPTKDDVLTTIVQHALHGNEFQLAHQASELFFSMPKKDQAKKLIIDCVGNAKS